MRTPFRAREYNRKTEFVIAAEPVAITQSEIVLRFGLASLMIICVACYHSGSMEFFIDGVLYQMVM